ncbi:MAG: hypothetical protein E7289_02675 [Lachnospiraceae bacterium]|nr:hypothetical protein [Lachnospiraceae bacterium]
MFEALFQRKKVNNEKLKSYGFSQKNNSYFYITDILDGQFELQICISCEGTVDTGVFDKNTGDEYVLYKTGATGTFVGEIRESCETVLKEVANCCYDVDIFKYNQTKRLIDYVRSKYRDELEFLWETSPSNAVWRRKDTMKWYGAVLTISKSKLGLMSDEIVEVVDLHAKTERVEELLQKDGYYPGWHMNKKYWYTIILDDSISDEELFRRIDESYDMAKRGK